MRARIIGADKIYVGTVGIPVYFEMGRDVSGLDNDVTVNKPSSSTTWTTTVVDGPAGIVQHILEAGDFNEAGEYRFNAIYDDSPEYVPGETASLFVNAIGT